MSCPFCKSDAVIEILPAKEMTKGTRTVFEYAVCANCASAYITKFPDDISQYYEDYYSFGEETLSVDDSKWKSLTVDIYSRLIVRTGLSFLVRSFFRCPSAWQMQFLTPNLQAFLFIGAKPGVRILDVGSGSGQFVRLMRRFGYTTATGIDPFLKELPGHDYVRRGDINGTSGVYDILIFNHTLEHMPDPEAALNTSARLLSPDGVLLIQIPNLESREFSRFKEHWCWLHAPFHFAIPSRRGVELLADRSGFRVVDAICTSRADHYLYHDEYARDIADHDQNSVRRALEDGSFNKAHYSELSRLAHSLNKTLTGDWIAYYLKRA